MSAVKAMKPSNVQRATTAWGGRLPDWVAALAANCDLQTQREVAEELGVSTGYLNDYLHFRREPGPKLLEALGLYRVISYERIDKE